jgi:hypothetical protein
MNKRINTSLIIFTLFFALYIYSACRLNPSYADSDELITVGNLLGVAHPSGYPLQILLVKLFSLLPISGSVAFKANILSGFLNSLALVFIYRICRHLLEIELKVEERISKTASIGAISILGVSTLFWLYSSVCEVFALNNLLISLTILFALKWRSDFLKGKDNNKWYFATTVFLGLGLSHLQTFVLIFPGILLIFLLTVFKFEKGKISFRDERNKSIGSIFKEIIRFRREDIKGKNSWFFKKVVTAIIVFLVSYFGTNLLLFWLNSRQVDISWYFPNTLEGWQHQLLRKVYSVDSFKNKAVFSAYINDFDLGKYFYAFPRYWGFLIEHFSVLGVLIGALGVVWLFRKSKEILYILLSLFVFSGIIFALHMGIPNSSEAGLYYNSKVGLMHRQYLQGEVIWSFLIGIGLASSYEIFLKYLKNNQKALGLLVGLVGLLFLINFGGNYSTGVQKDTSSGRDYAHKVLDSVDDGSVIICTADFPCLSLIYAQQIEKYKPGVTVLTRNRFLMEYFLKRNPDYIGYAYGEAVTYMGDLVSWNVSKRPTYLTDATAEDLKYLGVNEGIFYLIPHNYVFKVTREIPEIIKESDYSLTEEVISKYNVKKNYWQSGLRDYFAYIHITLAKLYNYLGDKEKANENEMLSSRLHPGNKESEELKLAIAMNTNFGAYKTQNTAMSSNKLLEISKEFKDKGNKMMAIQTARYAVLADPLNKEARINLALILEELGGIEFALEEYRNVLKYFSQDSEANKQVQRLNSGVESNLK